MLLFSLSSYLLFFCFNSISASTVFRVCVCECLRLFSIISVVFTFYYCLRNRKAVQLSGLLDWLLQIYSLARCHMAPKTTTNNVLITITATTLISVNYCDQLRARENITEIKGWSSCLLATVNFLRDRRANKRERVRIRRKTVCSPYASFDLTLPP